MSLLFGLLLLMNSGLDLDPALSLEAQRRAEAIHESGALQHDLKPYVQSGDCAVGEVLSRGHQPGAAFVEWWYSPSHHAVMSDPAFDRAGIGMAGDVIVVAYRGYCR